MYFAIKPCKCHVHVVHMLRYKLRNNVGVVSKELLTYFLLENSTQCYDLLFKLIIMGISSSTFKLNIRYNFCHLFLISYIS